jgi:hypothetical protein
MTETVLANNTDVRKGSFPIPGKGPLLCAMLIFY